MLAILAISATMLWTITLFPASAYFQENLSPDSDRDMELQYTIETSDNSDDGVAHTQMALSLLNQANSEHIRYVTYILTITKADDEEPLLRMERLYLT